MKKKFLVVGAGFSGAVVAEQLSKNPNHEITVIDERGHIGGNCYTSIDPDTGVTIHEYGPHIFNTDNEDVWNYIQQFCEMKPFINRVKSVFNGKVYSLPINLHTINQFFDKCLNPEEAEKFIYSQGDFAIHEPKNFEEQALKFIGKDLYEAFFYGYTKKQWGCEPKELPASILKRLPVRFDYNDNYYSSRFQGIPKEGYTKIFEKMLNRANIAVKLNTHFSKSWDLSPYDFVFYTGPLDAFFDFKFGRLSYRTVRFEKFTAQGDYQGNAVINYANADVPYTRVHEHKHFTPWEKFDKTVYFKEYSKETEPGDVPYYPKRLSKDIEMLSLYQQELELYPQVSFIGRLATYRYMDMHQVIAEALFATNKFL